MGVYSPAGGSGAPGPPGPAGPTGPQGPAGPPGSGGGGGSWTPTITSWVSFNGQFYMSSGPLIANTMRITPIFVDHALTIDQIAIPVYSTTGATAVNFRVCWYACDPTTSIPGGPIVYDFGTATIAPSTAQGWIPTTLAAPIAVAAGKYGAAVINDTNAGAGSQFAIIYQGTDSRVGQTGIPAIGGSSAWYSTSVPPTTPPNPLTGVVGLTTTISGIPIIYHQQ